MKSDEWKESDEATHIKWWHYMNGVDSPVKTGSSTKTNITNGRFVCVCGGCVCVCVYMNEVFLM